MGMNSGNTYASQEPAYDPNAPLYQPEKDDYDPNAPLYRPENDAYDPNAPLYQSTYSPPVSVHKAVKVNNTPQIIAAIVILVLAIAVGGFLSWKFIFQKQTIKEYWESSAGQREVATLKTQFLAQNPDALDFAIRVEGDDKLVYEVKYDMYSITAQDKAALDFVMESMKPSLQAEMKKIMSRNKLKPFSVIFRYKSKNDTVMAEYTIAIE